MSSKNEELLPAETVKRKRTRHEPEKVESFFNPTYESNDPDLDLELESDLDSDSDSSSKKEELPPATASAALELPAASAALELPAASSGSASEKSKILSDDKEDDAPPTLDDILTVSEIKKLYDTFTEKSNLILDDSSMKNLVVTEDNIHFFKKKYNKILNIQDLKDKSITELIKFICLLYIYYKEYNGIIGNNLNINDISIIGNIKLNFRNETTNILNLLKIAQKSINGTKNIINLLKIFIDIDTINQYFLPIKQGGENINISKKNDDFKQNIYNNLLSLKNTTEYNYINNLIGNYIYYDNFHNINNNDDEIDKYNLKLFIDDDDLFLNIQEYYYILILINNIELLIKMIDFIKDNPTNFEYKNYYVYLITNFKKFLIYFIDFDVKKFLLHDRIDDTHLDFLKEVNKYLKNIFIFKYFINEDKKDFLKNIIIPEEIYKFEKEKKVKNSLTGGGFDFTIDIKKLNKLNNFIESCKNKKDISVITKIQDKITKVLNNESINLYDKKYIDKIISICNKNKDKEEYIKLKNIIIFFNKYNGGGSIDKADYIYNYNNYYKKNYNGNIKKFFKDNDEKFKTENFLLLLNDEDKNKIISIFEIEEKNDSYLRLYYQNQKCLKNLTEKEEEILRKKKELQEREVDFLKKIQISNDKEKELLLELETEKNNKGLKSEEEEEIKQKEEKIIQKEEKIKQKEEEIKQKEKEIEIIKEEAKKIIETVTEEKEKTKIMKEETESKLLIINEKQREAQQKLEEAEKKLNGLISSEDDIQNLRDEKNKIKIELENIKKNKIELEENLNIQKNKNVLNDNLLNEKEETNKNLRRELEEKEEKLSNEEKDRIKILQEKENIEKKNNELLEELKKEKEKIDNKNNFDKTIYFLYKNRIEINEDIKNYLLFINKITSKYDNIILKMLNSEIISDEEITSIIPKNIIDEINIFIANYTTEFFKMSETLEEDIIKTSGGKIETNNDKITFLFYNDYLNLDYDSRSKFKKSIISEKKYKKIIIDDENYKYKFNEMIFLLEKMFLTDVINSFKIFKKKYIDTDNIIDKKYTFNKQDKKYEDYNNYLLKLNFELFDIEMKSIYDLMFKLQLDDFNIDYMITNYYHILYYIYNNYILTEDNYYLAKKINKYFYDITLYIFIYIIKIYNIKISDDKGGFDLSINNISEEIESYEYLFSDFLYNSILRNKYLSKIYLKYKENDIKKVLYNILLYIIKDKEININVNLLFRVLYEYNYNYYLILGIINLFSLDININEIIENKKFTGKITDNFNFIDNIKKNEIFNSNKIKINKINIYLKNIKVEEANLNFANYYDNFFKTYIKKIDDYIKYIDSSKYDIYWFDIVKFYIIKRVLEINQENINSSNYGYYKPSKLDNYFNKSEIKYDYDTRSKNLNNFLKDNYNIFIDIIMKIILIQILDKKKIYTGKKYLNFKVNNKIDDIDTYYINLQKELDNDIKSLEENIRKEEEKILKYNNIYDYLDLKYNRFNDLVLENQNDDNSFIISKFSNDDIDSLKNFLIKIVEFFSIHNEIDIRYQKISTNRFSRLKRNIDSILEEYEKKKIGGNNKDVDKEINDISNNYYKIIKSLELIKKNLDNVIYNYKDYSSINTVDIENIRDDTNINISTMQSYISRINGEISKYNDEKVPYLEKIKENKLDELFSFIEKLDDNIDNNFGSKIKNIKSLYNETIDNKHEILSDTYIDICSIYEKLYNNYYIFLKRNKDLVEKIITLKTTKDNLELEQVKKDNSLINDESIKRQIEKQTTSISGGYDKNIEDNYNELISKIDNFKIRYDKIIIYIKQIFNSSKVDKNNIKNIVLKSDEFDVSIFENILNNYIKDINENKKSKALIEEEFYNRVKLNNLDPKDNISINTTDKAIFIGLIFIFRIISLYLVEKAISNNVITNITAALKYYVIIYVILIIIVILIVNLDLYKMRIMFNYFNFHSNMYGIITHILMVFLITYLLYLLMINTMDPSIVSQKKDFLSDSEKIKLSFKIDIFSIIIFIFVSIIAFVI